VADVRALDVNDTDTTVAATATSRFRGHRALLAALVVDGVGSGLFLPFAVLYFLHTTTISLAVVGGSLTAASLLALPTPLVVGPLIDRFGPRRLAVVGNLLSAAAFTGYLFVDSPWQLGTAAFVTSVGQTTSWTAVVGLVGMVAAPDERAHWFAVQSATRNAGYGVGGIAGAVAVSFGGAWAYLLLAAINAVSYLIVTAVLANWRVRTATTAPSEPIADPAVKPIRYRDVLRNRQLLVIIGANLALVICMSVLTVLVTVYLTDVLGQPAWLGGALFTLNTVLVLLAQTTVTRRVNGYRRPRVVQGASAAWALAFACLWLLEAAPGWLVLPGAVLAVCACTIAEMLHAPTINALAVDTAPSTASGRYLAVYQLSWGLGSALAPGILIWLLSRGEQWLWPVLMVMCVLAASGIGMLLRRPQQAS
jgi:MFS family permease